MMFYISAGRFRKQKGIDLSVWLSVTFSVPLRVLHCDFRSVYIMFVWRDLRSWSLTTVCLSIYSVYIKYSHLLHFIHLICVIEDCTVLCVDKWRNPELNT